MAKNIEGEFAFFICRIRHFAMPPPPLLLMPVLDEAGSGRRNLGRLSGFQLVYSSTVTKAIAGLQIRALLKLQGCLYNN